MTVVEMTVKRVFGDFGIIVLIEFDRTFASQVVVRVDRTDVRQSIDVEVRMTKCVLIAVRR